MAWNLLLFSNCTIESDNCLFDEMWRNWWKIGKCSKVFGVTIKHFLQKTLKSSKRLVQHKNNMKSFNCLAILLLIYFTHARKDPNDNLWIDFASKMPVKIQTQGAYSVNIPCQSRFGDCQATYSIVPPGWTVMEDGNLMIPERDASGYGVYAIKATLSNIISDQLQADLVCTLNNGVFAVYDRNEFFKMNGYQQKNSVSKQADSKYNLPSKKTQIEGFPTATELQNLIKTGNIYKVSQKMKQISQKYAPCKPRISYLNQALTLLLQKLSEGENIVREYEQQISKSKSQIYNLEQDRKKIEKDLNSDKSFTDIKLSLKALNTSRQTTKTNFERFSFLADRYLKILYKPDQMANNQSKQEIQIAKLEEEMATVDKIIKDALEKKKKLSQQIQAKKAKLPKANPDNSGNAPGNSKQKQKQLMAMYESKFREYSQKAMDLKMQLKSIDQKIGTMTARFNIRNADLANTEQLLKEQTEKLAQYQSSTAMKAQQQQTNINQIYRLSADNMKSKINMLSNAQCV